MSLVVVGVCPRVLFRNILFRNTLCTEVPELPSGLEFSRGFAYAEASWGASCVSRSGKAEVALAIHLCLFVIPSGATGSI